VCVRLYLTECVCVSVGRVCRCVGGVSDGVDRCVRGGLSVWVCVSGCQLVKVCA